MIAVVAIFLGSYLTLQALNDGAADEHEFRHGEYGGAATFSICVDGDAAGFEAQDGAERVQAAADSSKNEAGSDWNALPRARVVARCPEGALQHVPPPGLERRVVERSPYMVHVFVTDEELPAAYVEVPYEMLCETPHNCGQVTTALFVRPEVLADMSILRQALEKTLGLNQPQVSDVPEPVPPTKDAFPVPTSPSRPVPEALRQKDICVVSESDNHDLEARVVNAVALAFELYGSGERLPAVDANCSGVACAEPPAGFSVDSLVTNDDLSAGGQRGVLIFVPAERGEMFLLADGFRRLAVNHKCDVSGCVETVAGIYVSPGLTDDQSLPNLAYGLWELLTGEDLP